jgi:hypothetical protein
VASILEHGISSPIQWAPRQSNKFLADPFAIARDKRIFVLCEEFEFKHFKGRIVSFEFDIGSPFPEPRVAMDFSFHVAYPYLVEDGGEVYCIPETWQARRVSLYRAERFPEKWKMVATLLSNFAGVDSAVFEHNGRWWLTCASRESAPLERLFVWHAPKLTGPWVPHSKNPVKKDIGSARPGGTPFLYRGELYRPAQDCSRTYGGRLVINRIVKLSPSDFEEEIVGVIDPPISEPYHDGIHTIASAGMTTVIDAKRVCFTWSAFRHAIVQGLAKVSGVLANTR